MVSHSYITYLSNGDSQDEPGWGTVGVAVKVPLAVDLAGQRLVGDVSDQPLGKPQARLISETAAFQLPAPLQNGPPETVGALVTHLEEGIEEGDEGGGREEEEEEERSRERGGSFVINGSTCFDNPVIFNMRTL